MTFDAAMKEKERFIPDAGFNVVGVNTYAIPGEALYLIGNFPTEEEATKIRDLQQQGSEDKFYVYPAR